MSAEMRLLSRTAKCTWQDCKTGDGILSEPEINPVVKKMSESQK
jgi:hypothetical protein